MISKMRVTKKTTRLKVLTLIAIFLIFSQQRIFSQGGLHVYGGVVQMKNKLEQFTPSGTYQSGNHFGADFTLNEGGMYFMLGVQFLNTDLVPDSTFSLTQHDITLRWLKPRVGLGYDIIGSGKPIRLRMKTLASFDLMIHNEATSAFAVDPPLNDGAASGIFGLGLSLGPFRIDAEYHIGVINSYYQLKGSNYNFLLLNVGFFF